MFRTLPDDLLRIFLAAHRWLEHRIGITIPIFWGQGLFKFSKFSLGLIPNAVPVITVVGSPIRVQRYVPYCCAAQHRAAKKVVVSTHASTLYIECLHIACKLYGKSMIASYINSDESTAVIALTAKLCQ